ncbi:MAG: hypothetical protein K0Q63_1997 [Paenibacillus sp.]|nr:hypothetical protein [Paenibacillus sp.]
MRNSWQHILDELGMDSTFDAIRDRIRPKIFDHLIRKEKGHTEEVARLDYCHAGRESSVYYAASVSLGKMDENEGLLLLLELEKLQVRDAEHPQFGGFRWYREETRIDDTNAAFFIMAPLATLSLTASENIPGSHLSVIKRMAQRAVNWFAHECAHPKLFYPNKIMSDGSLLLALSVLLDDEEGRRNAKRFFLRWEEYTTRRGWGWGENNSAIYLKIMLDALQLALRAWNGSEPELEFAIRARRNELLDYVRFHEGREFVPSIRSYNFEGDVIKRSVVNWVAGIRIWEEETVNQTEALVLSVLLYEELLPEETSLVSTQPWELLPAYNQLPVPRTRAERLFDDAYAYTWIGKQCRIGSINRFPIMPGCYQWPKWGLGWQSMPVSFLIENEQVSFLRFKVKVNNAVRSHLSRDYNESYLNPALFQEDCLPEIETRCAQQDHVLIVHREMKHLANRASEITDEWFIQRFQGKVHQLKGNNRVQWTRTSSVTHSVSRKEEAVSVPWTVIEYASCYAAILPLGYIAYGQEPQTSDIEVASADGTLTLSRIWYRGDERMLRQHRLDHAWVVIMIDEKPDLDQLQKLLDQYEIQDKRLADYEVPRNDQFMIREITVKQPNGSTVALRVDPYQ